MKHPLFTKAIVIYIGNLKKYFAYKQNKNLDLYFKPLKSVNQDRSLDGRGIGWGDHFLPHKFIERSFEH